jgi:formylglycine-generating enzyme required for sulfatase activity
VRFRALELYERREALAEILHRLAAERDSRRDEHRTYIDAVATAQAIQGLADDDARLRSCLAVATALAHLDEQLRESRLRRLGVLDRIQAEAAQPDPLGTAEGGKILREADTEVRLMLSQQAEQSRRMDVLRRQVTAFANAIPPPPDFQKASGVPMRLAGAGTDAFYTSAVAVTASQFQRFVQAQPPGPERSAWETRLAELTADATLGGISWYEARRFCQWLSVQDDVEYRLPSTREASILARSHALDSGAFWCLDLWQPPDYRQRRDLKRFGIDLVTLWDCAAGLGSGAGAGGEVPFARYPSLVVYLVAARQAGIAHRWQRVRTPAP